MQDSIDPKKEIKQGAAYLSLSAIPLISLPVAAVDIANFNAFDDSTFLGELDFLDWLKTKIKTIQIIRIKRTIERLNR